MVVKIVVRISKRRIFLKFNNSRLPKKDQFKSLDGFDLLDSVQIINPSAFGTSYIKTVFRAAIVWSIQILPAVYIVSNYRDSNYHFF